MAQTLLERVEQVLDEMVRPSLAEHQGNVEVRTLEDGVLKLRFLGKCSGCPGARLTMEGVVTTPIQEALPEIKDVVLVTDVSDDLLETARAIMRQRHAL